MENIKMKNIIELNFILVLLTSFVIYAQNNVPTVTNVSFWERTDSSFIIDINYDINDADNDTMTVTVNVSTDAGQTWTFAVSNISGDYGAGIISGTGKHIVWNFGVEHPQFFTDQMQIKIVADDGVDSKSCPGLPTVTYGGKTYNTVQIGTQCWLRENLDVGTMVQSTTVGSQQTDNGVIEKYCFDNDAANCDTYGGLYEWPEAMQYVTTEGSQGICPSGWHIPTYAEMQALKTYVNNQAVKLIDESQTMINGLTPTNETGFSAMFAGFRNYGSGSFINLGTYTEFWSSTESGSGAYHIHMYNGYSAVTLGNTNKSNGFSVRCLKD